MIWQLKWVSKRFRLSDMTVRFAQEKDFERVNELRRQDDLHTEGRPDIFKPGFPSELRDCIIGKTVIVAESGENIIGYCVVSPDHKKETLFQYGRDFLEVDENGVDPDCRRQGAGSAMMDFIEAYAKEKGYSRIELNMWAFNEEALAFYEAAGFSTYRRYLEKSI